MYYVFPLRILVIVYRIPVTHTSHNIGVRLPTLPDTFAWLPRKVTTLRKQRCTIIECRPRTLVQYIRCILSPGVYMLTLCCNARVKLT